MTTSIPLDRVVPAVRVQRLLQRFGPLGVALVMLVGWEGISRLVAVPAYLLPKPSDIVVAAWSNRTNLMWSTLTTLMETLLGFFFAVILGVLGAMGLASSRTLERSLYPYLIVLQTIPIVAIAPIIIIWFGAGLSSVVIITFLIGFCPMLSNTLIGLNSSDRGLKNLFFLYNATPWQTMWQLRVPASLPYIFAGMKITSSLCVIGAIVGEYVAGVGGGRGGLGYAITYAAMLIQTPYLFACGLMASTLGIVFYKAVSWLSDRVLGSWHETTFDDPRS